MKTCLDCGIGKPLGDFYSWKQDEKVRYGSYCKPCSRKRGKAYMKVKSHTKQFKQYQSKWRWNNRKKAIERLGGRCVNCGTTNHLVLEFNHLNGNPSHTTGYHTVIQIVKGTLTEKEVELRCGNCHTLYEYESGQRMNWDNFI